MPSLRCIIDFFCIMGFWIVEARPKEEIGRSQCMEVNCIIGSRKPRSINCSRELPYYGFADRVIPHEYVSARLLLIN